MDGEGKGDCVLVIRFTFLLWRKICMNESLNATVATKTALLLHGSRYSFKLQSDTVVKINHIPAPSPSNFFRPHTINYHPHPIPIKLTTIHIPSPQSTSTINNAHSGCCMHSTIKCTCISKLTNTPNVAVYLYTYFCSFVCKILHINSDYFVKCSNKSLF